MTDKKSWEEFRETKLLWFINTILHLFGWAIVVDKNDNGTLTAYPARVKFRGFSQDCNDKGYEILTKYLKDNSEELYNEVLEQKELEEAKLKSKE